MKKALLLAAVVALGWWLLRPDPVPAWEGRPAAEAPLQTSTGLPAPWKRGDITFVPLARFSVRAVVLSRERYYSGKDAELSPVDLALGWGRMSEAAVVNSFRFSQGQRWYEYTWRGAPAIPVPEIVRSSANMHLLPADAEVRKAALAVKRHELVEFSGWLVEVQGPGGWRWRSSLSREDSGAFSCEVVWVERIESRKL